VIIKDTTIPQVTTLPCEILCQKSSMSCAL